MRRVLLLGLLVAGGLMAGPAQGAARPASGAGACGVPGLVHP